MPVEDVFDFAVDSRNEFASNPRVRVMTKLTDGPVLALACSIPMRRPARHDTTAPAQPAPVSNEVT